MTVQIQQGPLQALVRFYERMSDAPALGWGYAKFGWVIELDKDGNPVDVKDLRLVIEKKTINREFLIPSPVNRRVNILANFLWDKTAYSLGRTAGDNKRTAQEHAAFIKENLEKIGETDDAGLQAFKAFLKNWTPQRFDAEPFTADMLDANIMFRLVDDSQYLHERSAVKKLIEKQNVDQEEGSAFCLVTGAYSKPARLHPVIKGVEGGSSLKNGGSLVSFNCDAFESYGKEQGANAPTSESAAFRYGAALNKMLQRGSRNRVARPIGDTTIVFWAEAADAKAAEAADEFGAFAISMDTNGDDAEAEKVAETLKRISKGEALHKVRPDLEEGTRFYVLGLAPNAARLSVRFWLSDTLDAFARNLAMHYQDIGIEPAPWRKLPSPFLLAVKTTAMQEKADNIPNRLAGDLLKAILTGNAYPRTWLSSVIMRLRAGDDPSTGWHAAAARAVLQRMKRKANPTISEKESVPVSLNRDYPNIGYQLGRLFAVYELAQRAALGGVNTSMRDKYFGAASATPASIFPVIIRNGQNHLAAVRKKLPGWSVMIEKELEEIFNKISPEEPSSFPRSLHLEQQGEFALGYYHQRSAKLAAQKDGQPIPEIENDQEDENV